MKEKLNVYYDQEGDFLELRIGKPTSSVYNEIGNDVFQRVDEKTGMIKGFAIFNFKKRTQKLKDIDIPLPMENNFLLELFYCEKEEIPLKKAYGEVKLNYGKQG